MAWWMCITMWQNVQQRGSAKPIVSTKQNGSTMLAHSANLESQTDSNLFQCTVAASAILPCLLIHNSPRQNAHPNQWYRCCTPHISTQFAFVQKILQWMILKAKLHKFGFSRKIYCSLSGQAEEWWSFSFPIKWRAFLCVVSLKWQL